MAAEPKDIFLFADIINKTIKTNKIKNDVNIDTKSGRLLKVEDTINIKNNIGIAIKKLRYRKKDL